MATHSIFDHNHALAGNGGAVAVQIYSGEGNTFTNNTSDAGFGGALSVTSNTSGTDDTFVANSALSGLGGAMYLQGNMAPLTNLTFANNQARAGGGLYVNTDGSGTFVTHSTFSNNHAVKNASVGPLNGYGGGIACGGPPTLYLSDSALTFNQADDDGGGIFCDGLFFASDCEIAHNTAGGAGGGVNYSPSPGTVYYMHLASSSVHDNSAHQDGGGIFVSLASTQVTVAESISETTISGNHADGSGGGIAEASANNLNALRVTASTIADNSAGVDAGGVHATLGVDIGNTIVSGNRAPTHANCGATAITSLGYNLAEDATCASFTAAGDKQNADAKLLSLANNGGSVLTQALGVGSAALDAGDVSRTLCNEASDNRASARSIDGNGDGVARCDIGAFESKPASLVVTLDSTTPQAPQAEGQVTYGFSVRNSGTGPASDVTFSMPLPTGFSFVSATASCQATATAVTCTLGALAVDSSFSFQIVLASSLGVTQFTGSATVTATTPSTGGTNTFTVSTPIAAPASADLAVTLSHFPTAPAAKTSFLLLVSVSNAGPGAASAVTLTQTLPAGTTASKLIDGCTQAGSTLTCNLGSQAAGQSRALYFTLSAPPASWATTATVSAAEPDPVAGNNTANDSGKRASGGCGCHTGGDASGMLAAFALACLVAQRRRKARR